MPGPPPKPPEQRRRRNRPEGGEWVDLSPRKGRVPGLPRHQGGWSPEAKAAWKSWWSDPAAAMWGPADVAQVEQLLLLSDALWKGKLSLAQEVRLRTDGLGLSEKGRRNLRWRVAPVTSASVSEVVPSQSRAARRDLGRAGTGREEACR